MKTVPIVRDVPSAKQTIVDAYIYQSRDAQFKIEAEGILQQVVLRKLIVPFREDPTRGIAITCGSSDD
jgi:hypothetical protein